ncbi:hypothetical protein [Lachnospira pectinoschiza]|uniref:Uncharacterized protein n=1 Tax=Lachnospira pectinoschiza TaxID=28052 RepID=A0A1G9Z2E4_9FIRM|nr:hypothetical protein [Lachnospira pectinoschiza]SDN15095.1 hypothetical protein SAMN05216544_1981 [Lachnospira pectinoschiza]
MLYLGSNDSKISNFNLTKMFEDYFYNIFKINSMCEKITNEEIENMIVGHKMIVVSLDETVLQTEHGDFLLNMIKKLLKRKAIYVRFLMYDYEDLPASFSWIVEKYNKYIQPLSYNDDPFDVFFKYTFPNIEVK